MNIRHNFLVAVLSSFELPTTGILPPLTNPNVIVSHALVVLVFLI